MRSSWRQSLACVFVIGGSLAVGALPARAQGTIGSLGGYGAMVGTSGASMGSAVVVPFGGEIVPSQMGGGGSLFFTARSSSMMSRNRPSFTIGPMGSEMPSNSGGMGLEFGRRPFTLPALGLSGGGMEPMTGSRGMGVMPPNFGSPFRQPPSLLTPSSAGAGMSM